MRQSTRRVSPTRLINCAEAAKLILPDVEAGMHALEETFDRLGDLKHSFVFFKKVLEAPREKRELPADDAGRAEFDRLMEAGLKGDVDEIDRITAKS